ncbi:MAG: glutamate--tRNA ligase, partial [Nitrosopumilus sp.]|nr:glutamate--tRNA ligase [Nitrosopumilus sp.]NNL53013.1 glutamate--tRNA ligase [Nitrosopumilus sp.]
DSLEAFNRKFVDAQSIRLFMVSDAKKLLVRNLSISSVEIPNHPINDKGKRKIEIDEKFYISGEDAKNFKEGARVRLLGLGNILIKKIGDEFEGELTNDEDTKEIAKIQWVPQKTAHQIKMIIPKVLFIEEEFNEDSLEEIDVYTEPYYLQLKEGEEIQFVRFGYCRKDSQNQAIFTHK